MRGHPTLNEGTPDVYFIALNDRFLGNEVYVGCPLIFAAASFRKKDGVMLAAAD